MIVPARSLIRLGATTLVLILAGVLPACRPGEADSSSDDAMQAESYVVYVGTGTGDEAEGIYTLRFDPATGALTRDAAVTVTFNPTYLTLSPDRRFLYAVSEGGQGGSVSAFRIDPDTGHLTYLNQQSSGGAGPAYVGIDATGRWVLVANYMGGSVALLPVQDDGRLGEASDSVQHSGSSVDPQRQEAPHAHYIHVDPTNRYAFAADLGIDRVRIYDLDLENGSLNGETVREVNTEPGAGPRHLDFHPNGRSVYLINELNGTVTTYAYDGAGGVTELQTVSTLPEDFEGDNKSADIHVHPSGAVLYASNRGDFDSIAIYTIDEATGTLTLAGHQTEGIRWPRNFAIDPSGAYMLVANRRANNVAVFRIDAATGALAPTGHSVELPQPTCIKFLPPE